MTNYDYGTGRRKTAAARVFISGGTGRILVNSRPLDEFFWSRDIANGGASAIGDSESCR